MIARQLINKLIAHLSEPEITMIIGARQTGKTTIAKNLLSHLKQQKIQSISFNLDVESDATFFESQQKLVNKIELEINSQQGYVFIDEIQRKENAGLFLKGLYDMGLPWKFIVTGSGSIELKEKIIESLAGRKRMFELSPVTFWEFCNYKTGEKYQNRLNKYFDLETEKTLLWLNEYMLFGGYPKVVTLQTREEKLRTLDEIYRAHAERDIVGLLGVERPEVYTKLMKQLAAQQGRLVNYSALSNQLGLNQATLKKYLYYAEKTYFIHLVYPFFANHSKEISKSPMVYFNDTGMRNFLLGVSDIYPGEGFTFQNAVYMLLREKTNFTGTNINYWRTTDKAEVDFIINKPNELIPVEVKFSHLKKPEITRSLRSFIEKYKPAKAWVINIDFDGTMKIGDTIIEFIPYQKLVFKEI